MRSALRAVVVLVWSGLLFPVAAGAQTNPDWHRAIPGFKLLYKSSPKSQWDTYRLFAVE